MGKKLLKLFLRIVISATMTSSIADRFGLWDKNAVWGSMDKFLDYTHQLLWWLPIEWVHMFGCLATILEILLSFFLLIGYKTELVAKLSGLLILSYALAILSVMGWKPLLDYSVLGIVGSCFAISIIKEKFLEIDSLIYNKRYPIDEIS